MIEPRTPNGLLLEKRGVEFVASYVGVEPSYVDFVFPSPVIFP